VPELKRRLVLAAFSLVLTIVLGTTGFWVIGDGAWALADCAYMTVVSATTVGFGETLEGMDHVPAARAWAVVVILLGVGTFGYAASMVTAFLVESDLTAGFRKKKMRKLIAELEGHMVVCGVGSTGRHVVREMAATRTPVVAVDTDEERLAALAEELAPAPVLYLVGDATHDEMLEQAGVTRARGIVAALPDDKDNLFIVISARGMNAGARIVSRCHDLRVAEKLRKAGANAMVSPNYIGGMRLASEMIRPNVVEFLDQMLRDRDRNLRIEEVAVSATSPIAGKTLRDARLRDHTDALVLALRDVTSRAFTYNPAPDAAIPPDSILVVLGTRDAVAKLRELVGAVG
jgi:voltage-gated potassium channel